jgi:hypothetical protein
VDARHYRLYNISSCMDCTVDEGAHSVLTLVGKGGCAGGRSRVRLPICAKAKVKSSLRKPEALSAPLITI